MSDGFLLFDNVKIVCWIFVLTMLSCGMNDGFFLLIM